MNVLARGDTVPYTADMQAFDVPDVLRRLSEIGWNQERIAEELDTTQATVSRWYSGSDPRGEKRDKLRELAGRLGILRDSAEVPLRGYVGAGAEAHFYATADDPNETVPAPDGWTENTVAVEIRGESLGELFDRWLVFYDDIRSPVTPDLIGRLCVVELPDGRVLIKKIKASRSGGTYHLLSNTEAPIFDVELVWAAKVKTMVPR